jgi:hypothetical protein
MVTYATIVTLDINDFIFCGYMNIPQVYLSVNLSFLVQMGLRLRTAGIELLAGAKEFFGWGKLDRN